MSSSVASSSPGRPITPVQRCRPAVASGACFEQDEPCPQDTVSEWRHAPSSSTSSRARSHTEPGEVPTTRRKARLNAASER